MLSTLLEKILLILTTVLVLIIIGLLIHCNSLKSEVTKAEQKYITLINTNATKQAQVKEVVTTKLDTASEKLEKENTNEKVKVEYVTQQIDKIITQPVFTNICISNDGLHEINSLIPDPDYASEPTSEPKKTS